MHVHLLFFLFYLTAEVVENATRKQTIRIPNKIRAEKFNLNKPEKTSLFLDEWVYVCDYVYLLQANMLLSTIYWWFVCVYAFLKHKIDILGKNVYMHVIKIHFGTIGMRILLSWFLYFIFSFCLFCQILPRINGRFLSEKNVHLHEFNEYKIIERQLKNEKKYLNKCRHCLNRNLWSKNIFSYTKIWTLRITFWANFARKFQCVFFSCYSIKSEININNMVELTFKRKNLRRISSSSLG